MLKKPQKFFDVFLENDLNSLTQYLYNRYEDIMEQNVLRLTNLEEMKNKFEYGSIPTYLGIDHYNVFTFTHEGIYNLHIALRDLTKQACKYYDIDFDSQKYMIHGWFNLDQKTPHDGKYGGVSPITNENQYHDHSAGLGAPWFHGYYCINAEPSSTFYKIDRDDTKIFENINKNNRAILSETGHPHGRGDWYKDDARITIAYDITPLNKVDQIHISKWSVL